MKINMMNKLQWAVVALSALTLVAALALTGCGASPEAAAAGHNIAPAPTANIVPPEQVVENFYVWYVGYFGDRAAGEMRNPLVDKAYRSSAELTAAFIQKVDALLAAPAPAAYDPFLCAQDIPQSCIVEPAGMSGDEAQVIVRELWNAGTEYEYSTMLTLTLRLVDGQWKIADIVCGGAETAPLK